jgi:hypothetical protein
MECHGWNVMDGMPALESTLIGLGDRQSSWLNVYIANRPPLDEYTYLEELRPLVVNDIDFIAQETGNHWRKIFNVFSKLIFSYYTVTKKDCDVATWQEFRNNILLQKNSGLRLIFTPPNLSEDSIHIIMGKQYAIDLGYHEDLHEGLVRLDNDFVIWPNKKIIICPYFDYRQLSNVKIERLVELMRSVPTIS